MITYTLQSNIFALIILSIIYKGAQKQSDLSVTRDRIFMNILKINALILLIDSISIFLYDVPGEMVYVIQSVFKATFYCLNPVPSLLWFLYAHDFIFHDSKALKRVFAVGIVPVIVNGILSIASIWGGYLFIIGAENSYNRGTLFFLMPIFAFTYTIVAFVMIVLNRSRINRQDFIPLLIFAIPPLVGGLLQTFIYGMVVLWPSLTVSLLIIYVFIQSKTMDTDFLTRLNNRRAFDYYLLDWEKWKNKDKTIAGFMMDMDDFKKINDTLGHETGDKALIEMSRILRESFRRNDFVSRLGGDEFAAIIEVYDTLEAEEIKEKLLENIKVFNKKNKSEYKLSISCGTGIFRPEEHGELSTFFIELDKRMYVDKQKKKNIQRK